MRTIFICIPWFLPAFRAGGPIQSIANMVREVHDNIQYRIFCADTDLNNIPLENIVTGKWNNYNAHTQVWYAVPKNRTTVLSRLIDEVKPHTLFLVGLYSWDFNIYPALFCKVPKTIISVRGMLHPGALSQKRLKKKVYLSIFKMFGLQKKVVFHATNDQEKDHILSYTGNHATVTVAGNFPGRLAVSTAPDKVAGKLHITSIALISPMKNHLLVLESLLSLPAKLQVHYHIYGPIKDEIYWKQCQEMIKKLPENCSVQYHGEAQPADVETFLSQTHVFILPSKSENFGHAIYEALAAGKPVITSHHTPWQNLRENRAGLNIDLNVDAVKEAISFFCMMDNATYSSWSDQTVGYAAEAIDKPTLNRQYKEMFF